MFSLPKAFLPATGLGLAILLQSEMTWAASLYSFLELPFLPTDINDRSQVVGQHYLWQAGQLTDLTTLPGAEGSPLFATAINNQGGISGGGLTVPQATRYQTVVPNQAFISDGQTIHDLGVVGVLCKDFCAPTTAIASQLQQTVFNFDNSDYQPYIPSYRRSTDGTLHLVYGGSPATASNRANQITGYTFSAGRSGPGMGWLWQGEGQTTLLTAPGTCRNSPRCFSASTIAKDLNDQGQVVGAGPLDSDFNAPVYALFWPDPQTNPVGLSLGSLGGSRVTGQYGQNFASIANGINNQQDIVGFSYAPDGNRHAVLWHQGQIADLNQLVALDPSWQLTEAVQINNQGQIVGTGYHNGQQQGFLLSPSDPHPPDTETPQSVPDPPLERSLLVLGLVGFASLGRRYRQLNTLK